MELYSHADPYKCYLHHPTPDVGPPRYTEGTSLEEYYDTASHTKVVREVTRLFENAFRTKVMFGQRHFAPSASWRDEHVAPRSGTEGPSRFAVRVHVFEQRANAGSFAERAGRYLGFVALRPEDHQPDSPADGAVDDGFDHVVEAEMACPSHMQRPRYHLIMTNASSARMGVLPFKSAVYMAPHRGENRTSTCMHLAISQALHLVMSRFGCRPISQREFDAYVWRLRCERHDPQDPNWPLLKHVGAEYEDENGGHEGGAKLVEALKILDACSAGGFVAHFSEDNYEDKPTAIAEAWRCLTDVLANGLPVVVMVNHKQLTKSAADRPHAQLIFGMRLLHCQSKLSPDREWENREDRAELPGEFIGHDVFKGPFFQTQADDLLQAAWDSTADLPPEKRKPGINFLVIGPRALKVDMRWARDFARLYMFSLVQQQTSGAALLEQYYKAAPLSDEWWESWRDHKTDWRYVVRFMGRQELLNRPDLAEHAQCVLPPHLCFWLVEVWHPHASHGMHANEVPTWPPPVLIWCNAAYDKNSQTPSDVAQRGVLHWSIENKTWVPVELNY